jgi:uncharacterized damage-inducible protein DinB
VRAELEKSYAFQDEHLFNRPATDIAAEIDNKHPFLIWEMIDWMIAHESQHRGQVMTLIRMAGFIPPKWA